jgi:hypothetical protein
MADVVVIATPGAVDANSHCTVEEGDTYHEAHPYPDDWDDASEGEKSRALVTATNLLNYWYEWKGTVSTLTQRLLWPRRGVIRPGISEDMVGSVRNPWSEPFAVLEDSSTVPERIKDATSELGRLLLGRDLTTDSDVAVRGVSRMKVGPVDISFNASVLTSKAIPDSVAIMVDPYGTRKSASGGSVKMGRG